MTQPKNKGGRPPHEPTDESRTMVGQATCFGHTQETIARWLGIDADTLAKHYRFELDNGKDLIEFQLAQSAAQKALNGDPRNNNIHIFLLKTRLGWKETDQQAMLENMAGMMEIMRPMTPEEWQERHNGASRPGRQPVTLNGGSH